MDKINQMLNEGCCIANDIPADKYKSKIHINKFTLKQAIELHIDNNRNLLAKSMLNWYSMLQKALYSWLHKKGS